MWAPGTQRAMLNSDLKPLWNETAPFGPLKDLPMRLSDPPAFFVQSSFWGACARPSCRCRGADPKRQLVAKSCRQSCSELPFLRHKGRGQGRALRPRRQVTASVPLAAGVATYHERAAARAATLHRARPRRRRSCNESSDSGRVKKQIFAGKGGYARRVLAFQYVARRSWPPVHSMSLRIMPGPRLLCVLARAIDGYLRCARRELYRTILGVL